MLYIQMKICIYQIKQNRLQEKLYQLWILKCDRSKVSSIDGFMAMSAKALADYDAGIRFKSIILNYEFIGIERLCSLIWCGFLCGK